MSLIKTTTLSGLSAALRMAGSLISVKVVATQLGPVGVAYLGQFQSLLTLISNLSIAGIGQGVVRETARLHSSNQDCTPLLSTAVKISFVSSALLAFCTLLMGRQISIWLFQQADLVHLIYTLSGSIFLFGIYQLIQAYLNGLSQTKVIIKSRIAGAGSSAVSTIVLVLLFGLEGALYALIIGQLAGIWILIKATEWKRFAEAIAFNQSFDFNTAKALFAFAGVGLISMLLLHVRQLCLRDYLIAHFSIQDAGYWQAVWKISEVYLNIITAALGLYYLPKLTGITDASQLRNEVFKTSAMLLPLVGLLAVSIYSVRTVLVSVLFSSDFQSVAPLLGWQLIGDFLKISAWMLSFLLPAKGMMKAYFITEVLFILLYGVLAVVLSKYIGLDGFTVAFAFTYGLYLLTMILIFKNFLFNSKPVWK